MSTPLEQNFSLTKCWSWNSRGCNLQPHEKQPSQSAFELISPVLWTAERQSQDAYACVFAAALTLHRAPVETT